METERPMDPAESESPTTSEGSNTPTADPPTHTGGGGSTVESDI